MAITTSQGGNVAAASDEVIISQGVKLFQAADSDSSGGESSKPSATLSGETFNFALPFPTYTSNGRDPSPPSQSLSQQGTHCNVNYTVRIDIVRKGLRRHERRVLPFALASSQKDLVLMLASVNQPPGSRYRLCICPAQPRPAKSTWT